ncbi:hypothetical protein DERF_013395, partial [Dermatophagoides farinae]
IKPHHHLTSVSIGCLKKNWPTDSCTVGLFQLTLPQSAATIPHRIPNVTVFFTVHHVHRTLWPDFFAFF